jgi:hypothetical protein
VRGGLQGLGHIPITRDLYWLECSRKLGYECPTKEDFWKEVKYMQLPTMHKMHASRTIHRVVAGGNRSGKTFAAAMECLPYLMWLGTSGWYISANYDMAEEFARKVQDILIGKLGMERVLRNDSLESWQFTYSPKTHILNMGTGSTLQLKSSESPDSLHAVPLDYIINDEAALMPYVIYDTRLIPRLADSGGWILNIGTFESLEANSEWFEEFFDIGQSPNDLGIESWHHPTEDNYHEFIAKGGETAEEVAEMYSTNWSKIVETNKGITWPLHEGDKVLIWNIDLAWLADQKRRIRPEIYAARYEAKRATSPYIVFPKWEVKEYVNNEKAEEMSAYDPELPVYLAVDPGGTYAVGVVQFKLNPDNTNELTKGYDLCLIDELYFQSTVTTHQVFDWCSRREWFENLNRTRHSWWPAMQGAIDDTANEQQMVWQHLARADPRIESLTLSSRKGDITAGIGTLQHFLDTGSMWANKKCIFWNFEMRRYQYVSPGYAAAGREDPRKKPVPKDAWNHLIKAIIYLVTCKFGYYGRDNGAVALTKEKLNDLYYANKDAKSSSRAVVSKYR